MSEEQTTKPKHNLWLRGVVMLLMGFAYQITGTLVLIVTMIQFVIKLLSGAPNEQLLSFGHSLGRYLQQIVDFLTFVSEEIPFPFSHWPAGD